MTSRPPVKWRVGFTVHEARNLRTTGGVTVDPLVVVKCAGLEFRTSIKKGKAGVVSWDESHQWSDLELKKRQLESLFIVFEVQAANAFWRNDTIGSCSVQLSLVHKRVSHQLRTRLPLLLLNEPDVHGELRVSVYVLGPKDVPIDPALHGDSENDEDGAARAAADDLRLAALDAGYEQSAAANRLADKNSRPYHLYVSVHRIEDLSMSPVKGERDPFVTVNFAGSKLKSTQARGTCSHSINECFRVPVVAPLHEDTVTVTVWDWNMVGKDERLAVGRFSFAELRAKPISHQWRYFYGFDPTETPDFTSFVSDAPPPPNCYFGRMLLSLRTERLESFKKLQPARVIAAKSIETLATIPMSVIIDVYAVTGIRGTVPPDTNRICVEAAVGTTTARSAWVECSDLPLREEEATGSFSNFFFDQPQGRIKTLTLSMPDSDHQQWDLIISVYEESRISSTARRIAWNTFSLRSLPTHVDSVLRAPSWTPLYMVPTAVGAVGSLLSPAMLILAGKAKAEYVMRGKRQFMAFADYEVRCYCIAGRHIPRLGISPPSTSVRVSVAGAAAVSSICPDTPFPAWEECVKLKCRLATDPSVGTGASVLAPITLTVTDSRATNTQFFLARTTCTYDRIIGKSVSSLEPLQPRWVRLYGRRTNEEAALLVSIDLVRWERASKTPYFDPVASLRKCDLTVALYGLRGLILPRKPATFFQWLLAGATTTTTDASKNVSRIRSPLVRASMVAYGAQGDTSSGTAVSLVYSSHKQRGKHSSSSSSSPVQISPLWQSGYYTNCDFFVSQTATVFIPDQPVYDPHIYISVYDRKVKSKYFLGDTSIRLLPQLPWITNLPTALAAVQSVPQFNDSVNLKKLAAATQRITADISSRKKGFVNLGILLLKEADEQTMADSRNNDTAGDAPDRVKSAWITSAGEPELLFESYAAFQAAGLHWFPISRNMLCLNVFTPAYMVLGCHGDASVEVERDAHDLRPRIAGRFEDFYDEPDWAPVPLKRNTPDAGMLEVGTAKVATAVSYREQTKCSLQSVPTSILQDDARFRKAFRDASVVPSGLRLRVYVPRCISLASPSNRKDLNPYLVFQLGNKSENFRGSAKEKTANPEFCCLFEADLNLPTQHRLEVSIYSRHGDVASKDELIGSTEIDLEGRWLSSEWQALMAGQQVPIELHELRVPGRPDAAYGAVQLWVEIMTPQQALEIPRTVLRENPPVGVEIRVVVWGTRALKVKNASKPCIDAQVQVALDCPTYGGRHPKTQCTDVHYFSKTGDAIFNWRCVFPEVRVPVPTCVLQIAAFDWQKLGPADFIGEVNLELKPYLDRVAQDLSGREYDVEFRLVNHDFAEHPGFVQVTVQMLPQQECNGKPAGLGREPPNRDPHLATPVDGRKWEDFLRTSGLTKDFSPLVKKLRWVLIVVLFFALFIIAIVYPGLFFQ